MIKETSLPNKLKIISENIPYVQSVSIGFWIKVGSRDEKEEFQGISHFIEHLLFKGTEKRTAKHIAEELERVGGSLNAFTSKENVCIYARVLSEDLDLAIDLIADMILNSSFNETDIEKEKKVIYEEIMMYEDTPSEQVHDIFSQKVWQGHPLGRSILGTTTSLENTKREDILDYFSNYFSLENIIISVAGKFDHDILINQLSLKFNSYYNESNFTINKTTPSFISTKYNKVKTTEQTHICVGTSGLASSNDKFYSLMLLNNILGGNISSRLFQKIREEMGLAYSIFSYVSSYTDNGLFVIYAGTNSKNTRVVIDEIFKQLRGICKNNLTDEELTLSKNQLKGNMLLSMENVTHRMSRNARSLMAHDKIITSDEIIQKIQLISLDDIYRLLEDSFDIDKFSIVAIGPDKEIFKEIN